MSWRGNCEGDPLSPAVGEAAQGGQAPLTPKSGWIFLLRCRSTIHSHAPRGEPRRGGERPWPHRYPIPVPSFSFLTSMISPEQFFKLWQGLPYPASVLLPPEMPARYRSSIAGGSLAVRDCRVLPRHFRAGSFKGIFRAAHKKSLSHPIKVQVCPAGLPDDFIGFLR